MMDNGIEYLEYKPGSELNIFHWAMNNEHWIEQNNQMKQNLNKRLTKDEWIIEQQQNKLNNNNKTIHNITGKRALCTT
jgi:hypothetical protein